MADLVQRVTVYTIKVGVLGDPHVRKIECVDGVDKKAKNDLADQVWRAFENDPTANKIVLRRSYIPADQST